MTTSALGTPWFFEDLGDGRFVAGPQTAGPWSPDAQHGGPPSALLTRALEKTAPRADMLLARITCEILGPMPVAEVQVRSEVLRPGKSVEMVGATMAAGGRDVLTARGWRIKRTTQPSTGTAAPPPMPETRDLIGEPGYLGTVEWHPVRGAFRTPGPSAVWTRLHAQVVRGEAPSPLQRMVSVADSGNGLSSVLPMDDYWFINPELTVHILREPVGEWVLVDAKTAVAQGGVGLARTVLSDADGEIGRGMQSLYIAPR